MAVRIRLARGGAKKRPIYRIVAADSRSPRDGRFIEKLGVYNPILANDGVRLTLNEERIKYWLGHGATPSDRVARFMGEAGIAPKPAIREQPIKSKPGAKAQERVKAAEEARKAAAAAPPAAPAAEEVTGAFFMPETAFLEKTFNDFSKVNLDLDSPLQVNDVTLIKDTLELHFKSGILHLAKPIEGEITGAYFEGEGTMTLTLLNEMEKKASHLAAT